MWLWQQRRWGGIVGGIGVGFDDDDFLIGDDFFGGVKEGETVDVVEEGGSVVVFFLGEEFKGFGLESEGEFLEHFRDLRGFGGGAIHFRHRERMGFEREKKRLN